MDADSKLSRMSDELVRTRNELSLMTVAMKNKEVEYQHQIDYLAHHAKKLRPMLQQTNLVKKDLSRFNTLLRFTTMANFARLHRLKKLMLRIHGDMHDVVQFLARYQSNANAEHEPNGIHFDMQSEIDSWQSAARALQRIGLPKTSALLLARRQQQQQLTSFGSGGPAAHPFGAVYVPSASDSNGSSASSVSGARSNLVVGPKHAAGSTMATITELNQQFREQQIRDRESGKSVAATTIDTAPAPAPAPASNSFFKYRVLPPTPQSGAGAAAATALPFAKSNSGAAPPDAAGTSADGAAADGSAAPLRINTIGPDPNDPTATTSPPASGGAAANAGGGGGSARVLVSTSSGVVSGALPFAGASAAAIAAANTLSPPPNTRTFYSTPASDNVPPLSPLPASPIQIPHAGSTAGAGGAGSTPPVLPSSTSMAIFDDLGIPSEKVVAATLAPINSAGAGTFGLTPLNSQPSSPTAASSATAYMNSHFGPGKAAGGNGNPALIAGRFVNRPAPLQVSEPATAAAAGNEDHLHPARSPLMTSGYPAYEFLLKLCTHVSDGAHVMKVVLSQILIEQTSLKTTCQSFMDRNVAICDEKIRIQAVCDEQTNRIAALEAENKKLRSDLARAVLSSNKMAERLLDRQQHHLNSAGVSHRASIIHPLDGAGGGGRPLPFGGTAGSQAGESDGSSASYLEQQRLKKEQRRASATGTRLATLSPAVSAILGEDDPSNAAAAGEQANGGGASAKRPQSQPAGTRRKARSPGRVGTAASERLYGLATAKHAQQQQQRAIEQQQQMQRAQLLMDKRGYDPATGFNVSNSVNGAFGAGYAGSPASSGVRNVGSPSPYRAVSARSSPAGVKHSASTPALRHAQSAASQPLSPDRVSQLIKAATGGGFSAAGSGGGGGGAAGGSMAGSSTEPAWNTVSQQLFVDISPPAGGGGGGAGAGKSGGNKSLAGSRSVASLPIPQSGGKSGGIKSPLSNSSASPLYSDRPAGGLWNNKSAADGGGGSVPQLQLSSTAPISGSSN